MNLEDGVPTKFFKITFSIFIYYYSFLKMVTSKIINKYKLSKEKKKHKKYNLFRNNQELRTQHCKRAYTSIDKDMN